MVLQVLQAARPEITQDLRALLVLRAAWEYHSSQGLVPDIHMQLAQK